MNEPPRRPCATCGGRQWRVRERRPVGGWECGLCTAALAERRRTYSTKPPKPGEDPAVDELQRVPWLRAVHVIMKGEDRGCWVSPRCRECPLPWCADELPRGAARRFVRRGQGMAMRGDRVGLRRLAEQFTPVPTTASP
jgi:hypothetical protein